MTFLAYFVPLVGPDIAAAGVLAEDSVLAKALNQDARVSLDLLHDAGYDIDQAPIAWWLLAPSKPKPLAEIEMPVYVSYLYGVLGEEWHNPGADALQAH